MKQRIFHFLEDAIVISLLVGFVSFWFMLKTMFTVNQDPCSDMNTGYIISVNNSDNNLDIYIDDVYLETITPQSEGQRITKPADETYQVKGLVNLEILETKEITLEQCEEVAALFGRNHE